MQSELYVRFLGVGDAAQQELGHASMVVECGEKKLLVDCGPGVLKSYVDMYQHLPDAVFITHCHLDHIADFENLFIKTWFSRQSHYRPKIFVPVHIIPFLHQRVATYPGVLAEGGVNFWEAFQLIPVSETFEFSGIVFDVFPARHHGMNSAFSLCVQDAFFYSGDTRPVPEVIEHCVSATTQIFHDCSVIGNPSHSGIDDVLREYLPQTIQRMYFYHYNNPQDVKIFEEKGLNVISKHQLFTFYIKTSVANAKLSL